MLACCIGVTLIALTVWILPLEVAQGWAVDRAGNDEFARHEAFDASAVALQFVRWASTASAVILATVWMKRRAMVPRLAKILTEFWHAAMPGHLSPDNTSRRNVIQAFVSRLFIVAWLMLALYHLGFSIQRRLWDWPVYRWLAGHTVLPNISASNREVIRYLSAKTPAGSRILILSDQKLFFLSYYLLPRRLYHPTHPDSEFVIAQPYNQRQLAAYRLQDLSPDQIDRLKPDYVLEYFEGMPYTQGEDLYRDPEWIDFEQRRHGLNWRPQFLVALQRRSAGGRP